jgi:hypothetical protein
MNGETNLAVLLKSLNPELSDESYVYICIKDHGEKLSKYEPWAMVTENEGITLIVTREKARRFNLRYENEYRRITLNVYSSLEAVGLTAEVSRKLTEKGISANIVAGYHHDHIFVQSEHAQRALMALKELGE